MLARLDVYNPRRQPDQDRLATATVRVRPLRRIPLSHSAGRCNGELEIR